MKSSKQTFTILAAAAALGLGGAAFAQGTAGTSSPSSSNTAATQNAGTPSSGGSTAMNNGSSTDKSMASGTNTASSSGTMSSDNSAGTKVASADTGSSSGKKMHKSKKMKADRN